MCNVVTDKVNVIYYNLIINMLNSAGTITNNLNYMILLQVILPEQQHYLVLLVYHRSKDNLFCICFLLAKLHFLDMKECFSLQK